METDAAVDLARALAREAGREADVVSAHRRGFRVVVDLGPYVVYVALDEAGARRLRLERELLRRLAGRVGAALPEPLVDHPGACLRLKVAGRAGLEHHAVAMADTVLARDYAIETARVMASFHAAMAPAELDAWCERGLPRTPRIDRADIERAAASLGPEAVERARACFDAAATGGERSFIHGDFGSHNMVVDERGVIAGVFDFEEAAACDRHHDMRWIPSYGEVALEVFATAYGRLIGPVDVARVRQRHALAALEQLGWGLRAPHEHHHTGRTLERTRAWAVQALGAAPAP